jgi:hypothetical protein
MQVQSDLGQWDRLVQSESILGCKERGKEGHMGWGMVLGMVLAKGATSMAIHSLCSSS